MVSKKPKKPVTSKSKAPTVAQAIEPKGGKKPKTKRVKPAVKSMEAPKSKSSTGKKKSKRKSKSDKGTQRNTT